MKGDNMIPFLDIRRELKYKKDTKIDIFVSLLGFIALICAIIGLVAGIIYTDIVAIVYCSIWLPVLVFVTIQQIVWAIQDYKIYKLVKMMNILALEYSSLTVATEMLFKKLEAEKEEKPKTTTKKKTTRKRK